ncbi:hypothetical protein AB0J72_57250 [Dactylosporangium sp. NPDC049742]|uniref:hypothetical protein n=1 Tax=Dactylosporangium sp. NPDC049742 TaxID=3154737 RepID=UPI00342F4A54
MAGGRGELRELGVVDGEVEEYRTTTDLLPADADLRTALLRSDGRRIWAAEDLATVTEADEHDPTWLQFHAAINAINQQQPTEKRDTAGG